MGTTVLLASGRLGRQIAVNRSNRPVYIDSQGKRVCVHGERAGTILAFLQAERAASDPSGVRYPSVCDCTNIDGLMSAYPDADGATEPSSESLFELLGVLGADEKAVDGRPQRKALTTGTDEIWIQPTGTVVCKHGNTKKTLRKMKLGSAAAVYKRKSTVRCDCTLVAPRRVGSVFSTTPRLKASAVRVQ